MNIVAIGAHPDDIEIGCGGAIAKHVSQGDTVTFIIMTDGSSGGVSSEVRESEARNAAKILNVKEVHLLGYKDASLPGDKSVIDQVEKIILLASPDRVYIPYHHEIHQDHRTTSAVALSACRNVRQILMYEGPSTMSDFHVNYWINIEGHTEKKAESIRAHASQGEKEILKIDAILGMNTFRGYQARSTFAEGFVISRFLE
ncbi:MAG: hypothetical protein JWO50_260 [Candidatus Kaiserbacteria bacterium]|nr:hypothetical protein [Candidatus Kaiserbacteria bacterium]